MGAAPVGGATPEIAAKTTMTALTPPKAGTRRRSCRGRRGRTTFLPAASNAATNAPIKSLTVQELHDRIIAGSIDVIDVRPAHARAIAPFPQPHDVLDEASRERLEAIPKDVPLAFLCHHGSSSRRAAEHFRSLGFHDLYNVEGGIDAWSKEIDPGVPIY